MQAFFNKKQKKISYSFRVAYSISVKTKDELHAASLLEEIKPHSVIKIKSSGFLGDAECMLRTDDIDSVLIHEKKETI